jgi:glycosyltransferase involved in cell wall biosynthesis
LSIAISKKKILYNYQIDKLNNHIHNSQIIKIKNDEEIIKHINNSTYEIIINNKLNEYFSLLPKINSNIKQYVITHNSMDPFNQLILDNQQYISKIFTINEYHIKLIKKYILYDNICIQKYINYVDSEIKINKRNNFTYKIVFVGRLSKEKGINLLISAFIKFIDIFTNIELLIIGDSNKTKIEESDFFVKHDKIKYLGKLNEKDIKIILSQSDYLILPSYTEGLPFVILEAMSIGIPCIYTNIVGSNEIINSENGFLFNLEYYEDVKNCINSWKVFDIAEKYINININNLYECLKKAYSINIITWNIMSSNCYNFIKKYYEKKIADTLNEQNLILF